MFGMIYSPEGTYTFLSETILFITYITFKFHINYYNIIYFYILYLKNSGDKMNMHK